MSWEGASSCKTPIVTLTAPSMVEIKGAFLYPHLQYRRNRNIPLSPLLGQAELNWKLGSGLQTYHPMMISPCFGGGNSLFTSQKPNCCCSTSSNNTWPNSLKETVWSTAIPACTLLFYYIGCLLQQISKGRPIQDRHLTFRQHKYNIPLLAGKLLSKWLSRSPGFILCIKTFGVNVPPPKKKPTKQPHQTVERTAISGNSTQILIIQLYLLYTV